jgi:branched-chain amino acid transport system substrate-binding protein
MTTQWKPRLLRGVISLAATVAMGSASAALSDDVVRIGLLVDMSGPYSQGTGMGSVRAAEMAVKDFGGKVLGKPVEVVYADHQNKTDIGLAKAREWIDTGKVDMILDTANSAIALAVQKLVEEKQRLIIVTGAGSTALSNKACSPNAVQYAYDTYALATGAAKALLAEGAKNWFILSVDYAFGQQLERDVRETIERGGGKVVGNAKHPLNAPDFSSYILSLQAAKPDAVVLANTGSDFSNALRTAREFGIEPNSKPQIAGTLVAAPDLKAVGLEVAQGTLYVDPFYWDFDEQTRAWSRRFMAVHKAMPSFAQAADYSAITQYLKAIAAAGSDEPQAVMKQLRGSKLNDFFLRNAYLREDGRMVRDLYLAQVKKPSESKNEWDLVTIQRVLPGADAFLPLSKSECPLVKK